MNAPAVDSKPPITRGSWLTQTWALCVDAYRELNNKRLFWITLILSLLVVLAFAFVGINDRGITVFGTQFDNVAWSTRIIPAGTFYKFIFTEIAIPWWLGLIATVLALVSVCSVFPDFVSGGSIDLYLSKPIGRLRLFITKYLTSLMFVALQVLIFSVGSIILIGLKSGTWEPRILLAVPLVTLFFSYLFSVCVLLGIVTRSPLASLLITILFWVMLFVVHSTEGALLFFKSTKDQQVEDQKRLIAANQAMVEKTASADGDGPATSPWDFQLKAQQARLPELERDAEKLAYWHSLFWRVKAPLPKTSETVDLMSRWLVERDPLQKAQAESRQQQEARRERRRAERGVPTRPAGDVQNATWDPENPQVVTRVQTEIDARSAAWIIGSSLAFEAAVLALAAWIFCRRDF